jgi:hypothetical protein
MLAERLQAQDMVLLSDSDASSKLNAADAALPGIERWTPTNWGMADFMDILGVEAAATFFAAAEQYTRGPFILFCRLVEQGRFDMSRPSSRELINLSVENGLLTDLQALKIFDTVRYVVHPSWAEHNKIHVDARAVGLARGGR